MTVDIVRHKTDFINNTCDLLHLMREIHNTSLSTVFSEIRENRDKIILTFIVPLTDDQLVIIDGIVSLHDSNGRSAFSKILEAKDNSLASGKQKDYLHIVKELTDEFDKTTWLDLQDFEKDIVIRYNAGGSSLEKMTYLQSDCKMEPEAANTMLIESWRVHQTNQIKACTLRWSYIEACVVTYLDKSDANILFDDTFTLSNSYLRLGRVGINYGGYRDGLMDYVESTNGFVNNGLLESGYTAVNGKTLIYFIASLKDIIVNGTY